MSKKQKISKETIVQTINNETGEVLNEVKSQTYRVDREPDYIKMYLHDITRVNDLPKGMTPILLELLKQMSYDNIIPAYKPIKLMICSRLGIKLDYLNKSISKFHKKGLIIRIHRGIYMADPELFARGKWEDIKNLRLVINYNENGTKKLKSNLPEEVQAKLDFN